MCKQITKVISKENISYTILQPEKFEGQYHLHICYLKEAAESFNSVELTNQYYDEQTKNMYPLSTIKIYEDENRKKKSLIFNELYIDHQNTEVDFDIYVSDANMIKKLHSSQPYQACKDKKAFEKNSLQPKPKLFFEDTKSWGGKNIVSAEGHFDLIITDGVTLGKIKVNYFEFKGEIDLKDEINKTYIFFEESIQADQIYANEIRMQNLRPYIKEMKAFNIEISRNFRGQIYEVNNITAENNLMVTNIDLSIPDKLYVGNNLKLDNAKLLTKGKQKTTHIGQEIIIDNSGQYNSFDTKINGLKKITLKNHSIMMHVKAYRNKPVSINIDPSSFMIERK